MGRSPPKPKKRGGGGITKHLVPGPKKWTSPSYGEEDNAQDRRKEGNLEEKRLVYKPGKGKKE